MTQNAGGVIGNGKYPYITDCNSNVKIKGKYYVGGIIGYLSNGNNSGYGYVLNCNTTGKIEGYSYVGGSVGNASGTAVINNCTNKANIEGIAYDNNYGDMFGGLIGYLSNSNTGIYESKNYGEITAYKLVGGICGSSIGMIGNCYNEGTIKNIFEFYNYSVYGFGGIAGQFQGDNKSIAQCNNAGDIIIKVKSGDLFSVGGIVGLNISQYSGSVVSSQNSGNIEISGNKVWGIGSLIGQYLADETNAFVAQLTNTGNIKISNINGEVFRVGGLIGQSTNNSMYSSSSSGNIEFINITGRTYDLGKFLGYCSGTMTFAGCSFTGNVSSPNNVIFEEICGNGTAIVNN